MYISVLYSCKSMTCRLTVRDTSTGPKHVVRFSPGWDVFLQSLDFCLNVHPQRCNSYVHKDGFEVRRD